MSLNYYYKKKYLFQKSSVLLLFVLMVLSFDAKSQLSPSSQSKIIVPSILSGCTIDTIEIHYTNLSGPSCTDGGAPLLATYAVAIPGGAEASYVASSLSSNANFVSYASNVLTYTVATPSLGVTTKVKFLISTSCNIVNVSPLPRLSVSVSYPSGVSPSSENWLSSKMNVGLGQLVQRQRGAWHGSLNNTVTPSNFTGVVGFAANVGDYIDFHNTGFGALEEIEYNVVIDDSLYYFYNGSAYNNVPVNPNQFQYFYSYNSAYGCINCDKWLTNTNTTLTTGTYGGKRWYKFKLSPELLGGNGQLDPGEILRFPLYLRGPNTCAPDQQIKRWINYKCANGSGSCQKSDTFYTTFKISAGNPIISVANAQVQQWDGCQNKSARFVFRNTGTPDATRPEVSTAYDVDLSVNLGGKLTISNLTFAGGTSVPTVQTIPGSTSQISWNIKNQLNFDPDGAGGLTDLDGDGYYDELKAGDSVVVTFNYTVDCDLACGANLNYDIQGVSSFTDYCKKLNGTGSVQIYRFGFQQTNAVSQITPVPNFGTMSTGQKRARTGEFTFNYRHWGIDTSQAIVKLRINYSKSNQVVEPIRFLGRSMTLSEFTVIGAGSLDTTNGNYNNTTDKDSALEYTLTKAEIRTLLNNVRDSFSYTLSHIACDSFQSQKNTDGFKILFQINTNNCPPVPCFLDLACNKGFNYNVIEGCGNFPCYRVKDSVYRTSPWGHSNENQTSVVTPTGAGASKFYEGDTMTYLQTSILSGDVPLMEPIGSAGNGTTNGFYQYFSLNYNKPKDLDIYSLNQPHFQFIEDISRVRVYDTTGGTLTLLYDVPLKFKHFYGHNGFATQNGNRSTLLFYDNITSGYIAPNTNSIPGVGLGDIWCNDNTWTLDQPFCPYLDHRYFSPNSIMEQVMVNEEGTRVSERYRLQYEMALIDAGINFSPGFTKYLWHVETKWRINPDYPHTNITDFRIRGGVNRDGNSISRPFESRTLVGACNNTNAIGTVVTKEMLVEGGRANYDAACGLNIHNKLFFSTTNGDYFPSEVRVPFKLDSFVVVLPTEYYTTSTSPTSLSGSNGAPSNSIQMSGTSLSSGYTGRILFTNNTANSGTSYNDFPRISDADGLQTAWDVLYSLSNAGTDNFIIQSYKVPVTYYLRTEFGAPYILIDTFIISEAQPEITIQPLSGAIQVEDGGTCKNSYMDVLVSNNTIYGASNVFIAAMSSTNTTVVDISDAGVTSDPIISSDTNQFGTDNIYAELGGMAAGDRRIVRITFNSSVCNDSLKIISNFGCNYPSSKKPEYPSTTIDSAYIVYSSVPPGLMSTPLNGNKNISNLCDVQTLEVEIRNVKNPNLTNLKIGFKLPASATYVSGSAQIGYPSNDYVNAPTVTTTGTDSVTIDISSDLNLANSCGLVGADESLPPGQTIAQNVVKVRINIDYNACPSGTSEEVFYGIKGQNFCGLTTSSDGVFNLIYAGNSTPSIFSCKAKPGSTLSVCASAGEISHVKDEFYIKNIGTGASSLADTLELTVGIDTSRLTLLNFSVGAPFTNISTRINAQGRPIVKIGIPAGLAVNDSFLLPLEYDIMPKVNGICNNPNLTCADISHTASFYSIPSIGCSAKSLSCPISGRIIKGEGFVPRDIICCASLGNFVWLDNDKDGVQDAGEPGVAGVNIDLYDGGPDGIAGNSDDVLVGSTKTDAYGYYLFDKLVPANYSLKITPPINYALTVQSNTVDSTAGTTAATNGSDFNPLTNKTYPIKLSPSENDLRIDAGLIFNQPTTASIGDKVWFDEDNDGIQDPSESGLAGVTVTLYNSSGQAVATTITDGNGNYLFDNLTAGNYTVGVTLPMGTKFSPNDVGSDETDSDLIPSTGRTSTISLAAGQAIRNVDIGIALIDASKASLGDRVWYDSDQDGIQDDGEIGVVGVEVRLLDYLGNIIATTYTDAFGNYMFSNLDPGEYKVAFIKPSGYDFSPQLISADFTEDSDPNISTGLTKPIYLAAGDKFLGIDAGIYQTSPAGTASLGDKVWYDVDNDGIQDANETGVAGITVTLYNSSGTPIATTSTDVDGNYKFINLPAGDYSVGFSNLPPEYSMTTQTNGTADGSDANPSTGRTPNITLSAGQNYPDLDLGITKGQAAGLGSIGNRVWNDVNQNGLQDAGEVGVGGVKVYLSKDLNNDGDFSDPGEMLADSTVTDGAGNYIFTNLPQGNYQVVFKGSTIPNGFTGTSANTGGDDAIDSDGVFNGTNYVSQTIPLAKGEDNMTIDLGIYVNNVNLGSIGNFIWIDTDGDGIQDAGEPGIQGVQVTLYDEDGRAIQVVTTDANGAYLFDGLPAGDYTVGLSNLPPGFTVSPTGAGTTSTDNDFNPTTKRSGVISLAAGEDNLTVDGGITPTKAVLGNYVWRDNDGDGVQDAGEPGIAGVTVTLYDGSGNAVASTITDADGKYLFTNLDPGTYSVGFSTIPSGLNWTVKDANTGTDGTDSDVDPLTGRTASVTLSAGDVNLTLDGGLAPAFLEVGNYVWMDDDNNGVQDADERPISGVLVKIFSVGGDGAKGGGDDVLLGSTITKEGKYLFTDLTPGTYYVQFINTFVGAPFTSPDNTGDAADSDADLGTGESAVFTLVNANNYTLDAGIFGSLAALEMNYIFTATKLNKVSLLEWELLNINTDVRSFDVYRSSNGVDFEKIGTVQFNGNNKNLFIDEKPMAGLNYYRISINTVSKTILTHIRVLNFDESINEVIKVYPNPSNGLLNIDAKGLTTESVEITIVDAHGKLILSKTIKSFTGFEVLNLKDLSEGVYQIQIQSEQQLLIQKVILMD